MDRLDTDHQLSLDFQQNMLVEMMKQHISSGLPFQYNNHYAEQHVHQHSDEDASSHVEHDPDENEPMPMPIVYKKRVRVKFTQQQVDTLEATFQQHRYPTIDMIDDLVEQLNLPTQKITVWFQNRRARLKKSEQKLKNNPSLEREDQQHYDSGIHLEDDVSRASSTSPPSTLFPHTSPNGYIPPPSPYYLPNPHQSFYNPMWQNFRYPFPSPMLSPHQSPYDFAQYNAPLVFQDIGNHPHQTAFHGSL